MFALVTGLFAKCVDTALSRAVRYSLTNTTNPTANISADILRAGDTTTVTTAELAATTNGQAILESFTFGHAMLERPGVHVVTVDMHATDGGMTSLLVTDSFFGQQFWLDVPNATLHREGEVMDGRWRKVNDKWLVHISDDAIYSGNAIATVTKADGTSAAHTVAHSKHCLCDGWPPLLRPPPAHSRATTHQLAGGDDDKGNEQQSA